MSSSSQNREPALRVVAIGGGTGLSSLLRGLKRYVAAPDATRPAAEPRPTPTPNPQPALRPCLIRDLAAIVTVTDDGGSSGRLREELNMLPPGDVRNCMVALSEDEHLLANLFQYRFQHGDLDGHSFGNLFLAALSAITGDFAQAVQMSSHILATRGRIYPATNTDVTLSARMDDGSLVHGETSITASPHRILELILEPADAEPLPATLDAIANADLITLGPGSLYTSLITNLLVRGIPQAIAASRATRVYIGNLMTQANESIGLTAAQHIEKILDHCNGATANCPSKRSRSQGCHPKRSEGSPHCAHGAHDSALRQGAPPPEAGKESRQSISCPRIFDYALVNTAPISPTLLEKYALGGQAPIEPDLDRIRALGIEPVPGDFAQQGSLLRHDPDRITHALLNLTRNRPARNN